jgi:hypothetical protein
MGGLGVLVLGLNVLGCTLKHVCTEQFINRVLLLSKALQLISRNVGGLPVAACTVATRETAPGPRLLCITG